MAISKSGNADGILFKICDIINDLLGFATGKKNWNKENSISLFSFYAVRQSNMAFIENGNTD